MHLIYADAVFKTTIRVLSRPFIDTEPYSGPSAISVLQREFDISNDADIRFRRNESDNIVRKLYITNVVEIQSIFNYSIVKVELVFVLQYMYI